jgi:tetratricopeptide (TPR) repeat protein
MISIDSSFPERYLDAANDYEKVTAFWNRYNQNPLDLLNGGQHWILRARLFELLDFCKKLNAEAFDKIHKGHPYYFIGIASFLMDDFQTAIYFFDAAVTEDVNFGAHPVDNPTPGTRLLMMEGEKPGHAAQPLAALAKAKVERMLEYYTTLVTLSDKKPKLDLENIRNNFIFRALTAKDKPGLRTLATAFISYIIEWDFRKDHFEYGVKQGTAEPFFLHLFRGCVLLESLLKHNPAISITGKQLYGMLNQPDVREALGITAIQGKRDGFTLDDVYQELQMDSNSLDQAFKIVYMARNTLGHNLGWDSNISHEQYQKLYFVIAAACLHVIACLWK